MSVEERVRSATRERTDLVRDIRPLDLPARPARRTHHAPWEPRWGQGWRGWAAPAAAAALVVALAITVISLREAGGGPSASPAASATLGGSTTVGAVPPRYYAALDDPSGTAFNDKTTTHVVDVVVGDTKTGRLLSTFSPPAGQTFAGLTAAADDRTFVVAAQSFPVPAGYLSTTAVAWYLLRLSPDGGKAASLTTLRIPGQPQGTQISGISLSPDGGKLAVMYQHAVWGVQPKTGPLTLSVYSVATGRALRTWTQPTGGFPAGYGWYWGRYSNSSMTWLDGGRTLAFDDGGLSGENGPPLAATFADVKIRTIDVTRPSGALLADSRVVYSGRYHWCETLQLTADGKTVFCGSYGGNGAKRGTGFAEIIRYSVATGRSRLVYRVNGAFNLGLANVLWLNANGSTLIGSYLAQDTKDGKPGYGVTASGVISNGTLKRLDFPLGPSYTGQIAF